MITFVTTNFEPIPDYFNCFVNNYCVCRQLGLIEFELKLFRIELLPVNQSIS